MSTAARLFTIALTTALTFNQLRAAVPFRPEGNTDGPSASLSASANSAALEHELKKQIDRYVIYPVMGVNADLFGDVVVSFVINTEGRVQVVDATSSNEALTRYVLTKLRKVDIGSNPGGVWKTSYVRFRFRPQA